jgi:outer membrane protein assembly factor BamB
MKGGAMFDIKQVDYAMWFANYQKNSCINTSVKASGNLLWKTELIKCEPNITIAPRGLLLNEGHLGYVSQSDILFFELEGKHLFTRNTDMNKPVVFFNGTVMASRPSSGFVTCFSYKGEDFIQEISVYGDWDYTKLMLLRPQDERIVAVTSFGGGVQRAPGSFHLSLAEYGKAIPIWSLDGDSEEINHVLLTPDEKFIIAELTGIISTNDKPVLKLESRELRMIQTEDGKISEKIDHGLTSIESASLNLQGDLVLAGTIEEDGMQSYVVRVLSLEGEEKWTCKVHSSELTQPPICTDDRVYIFADHNLLCLSQGKKLWETAILRQSPVWFTATPDGRLVYVAGRDCGLLSADGEEVFNIIVASPTETLETPPVIDKSGMIYVAGSENLYCIN